jgi:3-dehydroquinate dehydratase type I
MAYVCVALAERDLKRVVARAKGLKADIVEARLDALGDFSEIELLDRIKQQLMVTCMPMWEGGGFDGNEEKRAQILKEAAKYADYMSVELRCYPDMRDEIVSTCRKNKVKVVMTYHDFSCTPAKSEIVDILKAQQAAGADIAKVAFLPRDYVDVMNVLGAQLECGLKIPIIALSMGEIGRVSRIAGPMMGGYLTFAASKRDKGTACGQYSLDDMNSIRKLIWR